MVSDFKRDDAFQRDVRDHVIAPQFYGPYSIEGRYVFVDKGRLAGTLQKRYAVDTILQGRNGNAFCIEEKIVRPPKNGVPYTAYSLETHSCTNPGHESDGWMRYGKADYLLYAFCQPDGSVAVHLIDFPRLQKWFWPRVETFSTFGPLDTLNRSKGRLVPIKAVFDNVSAWRQVLSSPDRSAA